MHKTKANMQQAFRVLVRVKGEPSRNLVFEDSDEAWDVFCDALRSGRSAYLFENGVLIASPVRGKGAGESECTENAITPSGNVIRFPGGRDE